MGQRRSRQGWSNFRWRPMASPPTRIFSTVRQAAKATSTEPRGKRMYASRVPLTSCGREERDRPSICSTWKGYRILSQTMRGCQVVEVHLRVLARNQLSNTGIEEEDDPRCRRAIYLISTNAIVTHVVQFEESVDRPLNALTRSSKAIVEAREE